MLHPHRITDRCVTNSEWDEFIADGGYDTPTLWLSEGWEWKAREATAAPLYWRGGGTAFSDNRQRGNAAQLLEKYKSMARDAQLGGDRVQTEYYLQYAEHYYRMLGESRARGLAATLGRIATEPPFQLSRSVKAFWTAGPRAALVSHGGVHVNDGFCCERSGSLSIPG